MSTSLSFVRYKDSKPLARKHIQCLKEKNQRADIVRNIEFAQRVHYIINENARKSMKVTVNNQLHVLEQVKIVFTTSAAVAVEAFLPYSFLY